VNREMDIAMSTSCAARIQSTESGLVVALERDGLSRDAFANVNSYGASVVILLILALRFPRLHCPRSADVPLARTRTAILHDLTSLMAGSRHAHSGRASPPWMWWLVGGSTAIKRRSPGARGIAATIPVRAHGVEKGGTTTERRSPEGGTARLRRSHQLWRILTSPHPTP
jgi:hypothetical protein